MKIIGFILCMSAIAKANVQCVLTEIDSKMVPVSIETPLSAFETPATGQQLRATGQRFKNITAIVYKTKSGLTSIVVEANSNAEHGTYELIGQVQGRGELSFQSWRERQFTGEHIVVNCKEIK